MATHTITTIEGKPFILDGEWYYPVQDATEDITIVLSRRACQAGVRKGVANDPHHCHYATAFMEEKEAGVLSVYVRKSYTYLRLKRHPGAFIKYMNPNYVRDYIQEFDERAGRAVHFGDDMTCELMAVPESQRQGYRQRKNRRDVSLPKQKRKKARRTSFR